MLFYLFIFLFKIQCDIIESSYTSDLICFKYTIGFNNNIIECPNNEQMIVVSVLHENDYDYYCRRVKQNGDIEDGKFEEKTRCYALINNKNEEIYRQCNGKNKCEINLSINRNFLNGTQSNCNFKSDRFIVNYECIPNELNAQNSLPNFDVCKSNELDNIDQGYLTSPNYPKNYNGRKFCQLKIKVKQNKRLEMYLIDMELEKTSLITANPTDYLEINNNGKFFGDRSYEVIYNDTKDALITFKTDNFFNKRGFFVYFKIVDLPKPKTTTPTALSSITTTKIISTTIQIEVKPLKQNVQNLEFLLDFEDNSTNDSNTHVINSEPSSLNIQSIQINESTTKSTNNNNALDKINLIVFMLILFIIILIFIILSLIVFKRNTFLQTKPHILKSQSTNRNSSSTTSSSNTQYTDDSMIHLLLNSSVAQNRSINPNQIYEDLTENQPIAPSLPPPPLPTTKFTEDERVPNKNDYCYIQIPNVEITKSFYLNDTPTTNKKVLVQTSQIKLTTKNQSQNDTNNVTNESDSNCNYYRIPTNEPLEA